MWIYTYTIIYALTISHFCLLYNGNTAAKMKSGLNLYNAPTTFEMESRGEYIANKSRAGKESQAKRLLERSWKARVRLVVPARRSSELRILHIRLPWWKERRWGAGYDTNGNIPLVLPSYDFPRSLPAFSARARITHRRYAVARWNTIGSPMRVDLERSGDYTLSRENFSMNMSR